MPSRAGTFGARIARELAADLERAAREHRLGEAPALLGELARSWTG